jgi:hypothetical protein
MSNIIPRQFNQPYKVDIQVDIFEHDFGRSERYPTWINMPPKLYSKWLLYRPRGLRTVAELALGLPYIVSILTV